MDILMGNKYVCECCGGHINRATMRCEYCDTAYRELNDGVIRIETFRNPVDTYQTSIRISDTDLHAIQSSHGDYTKIILENMARELTLQLIPNMEVEMVRDMDSYHTSTIYGRVKVIRPVHTSDNLDALRYAIWK